MSSSKISETLISITSSLVFFLLDILDVFMCFFFRVLDKFLEGKASPCYCEERESGEEREDSFLESSLSESLHGRKNALSKMILHKFPRIYGEKEPFSVVEKKNRWSDCGCESCLSWMNNGSDSRLHFVVKKPERDNLENNNQEKPLQNVIFIHGFLSSSSLWTETVFPNLSENSKKNYRLFALDLLGFGKSPKPTDCFYTLQDHLEMIEKSVIVPFGVKSFHLVAHSMGCVIALALAAKYSQSVKSITLIAPPYFPSSKGDVSSETLKKLAARRVWPPLLFGSAFMSWYEHLGRCVCFFVCRNHTMWESIAMLLTRKRGLSRQIRDLTSHTHRSAWHTMHNVICGGTRFLDKYLEALTLARVKIYVGQGDKDEVVPLDCSFKMKMKAPYIEFDVFPNENHNSVILGRVNEFTKRLEKLWSSID